MPALLRKLLIPVAILVGLGCFVVAGFWGADADAPLVGVPALEQLIPARDAEILQQGVVGVDLQPGWEGRLRINSVPIPPEQLEQDSGLNQLLFRPGPGKVVTALDQNRNCAEITFWQTAEGAENAEPVVKWCFSVT